MPHWESSPIRACARLVPPLLHTSQRKDLREKLVLPTEDDIEFNSQAVMPYCESSPIRACARPVPPLLHTSQRKDLREKLVSPTEYDIVFNMRFTVASVQGLCRQQRTPAERKRRTCTCITVLCAFAYLARGRQSTGKRQREPLLPASALTHPAVPTRPNKTVP